VVAVAVNSSKKALFTTAERVELIRAATTGNKHVEVTQFEGLLVDFAKRSAPSSTSADCAPSATSSTSSDGTHEPHMSENFETVFMFVGGNDLHSSSVVREVAQHGGNLKGSCIRGRKSPGQEIREVTFFESIRERATALRARIVFPESDDERSCQLLWTRQDRNGYSAHHREGACCGSGGE